MSDINASTSRLVEKLLESDDQHEAKLTATWSTELEKRQQ
jgi:hypothetical protein